jgi:hypothetical protein
MVGESRRDRAYFIPLGAWKGFARSQEDSVARRIGAAQRVAAAAAVAKDCEAHGLERNRDMLGRLASIDDPRRDDLDRLPPGIAQFVRDRGAFTAGVVVEAAGGEYSGSDGGARIVALHVLRRPLSRRACAFAALALLVLSPVSALSQSALSASSSTEPDKERLARLERRLEILRQERDKQTKFVFAAGSLVNAQQLETQMLDELPKPQELINAAKTAWDGATTIIARTLVDKSPPLGKPGQRQPTAQDFRNAREKTGGALRGLWTFPQDALQAGVAISDLQAPRGNSKSALDQAIADDESKRAILKGALGFDTFTGVTGPIKLVGDTAITALLVRDSWARAGVSTTDAERQLYRGKALRESGHMITNMTEIGKGAFRENFAIELKLIQANADVWVPLVDMAAASYIAHGERASALAIRNDALDLQLNQILVTQWEIDQTERRLRLAATGGPLAQHEPGGIKLTGATADTFAAKLDITGVGYDPVRGRLVLTGRAGETAIDLSIFRDVLRLATERNDPFFSLEMSNPPDWDHSSAVAYDLIGRKYLGTGAGRAALAARLQTVGTVLPVRQDGVCYATRLLDVDADLEGQLESRVDIRLGRVYSPEWLANSKVGRILYAADVAIKSVASGLIRTEDGPAVAAVWDIDGFKPDWLIGGVLSAGRANFEIDDADVPADGGFVDLSQVKPKLVMVRRVPGTTKDDTPGEIEKRIAAHFSQHWQEYVRRIPVLAELMTVFRAYVAARYIVRRHPGLAQRILALGEPLPATGTPLYFVGSPTMVGCVEAGRLMPLRFASDAPISILPWPDGGVSVGLRRRGGGEKIRYVASGTAGTSNSDGFAARMMADDAPPYAVDGDRIGLSLDLDTIEPLPLARQFRLWAWFAAGAALASGLILFAWGRLRRTAAEIACDHCARIHRLTEAVGWTGDAAAIGCLAFVLWLPVAAAAEETGIAASGMALASLALAGAVLAPAMAAWAAQHAAGRAFGWRGDWSGPLRRFGAGARWLGLVVAAALLAGGSDDVAVAGRLSRLLGPALGERLFAVLGSAAALRAALLALLGSALIAAVARWIIPFLLDSRPLPLGVNRHRHEAKP